MKKTLMLSAVIVSLPFAWHTVCLWKEDLDLYIRDQEAWRMKMHMRFGQRMS